MKRTPTLDIIWLFLATRLLLLLVTYFGYILLTASKYSGAQVDLGAFFSSWNHWDAQRYLAIAQYGYKTPFDYAFFPLFPLLTNLLTPPLGSWSYMIVGMLISNAALLGVLFVLYRLAVENGGEQVARRTLLYLCIFPTALFFFAAYNESLFLLCVTGAFLALRRGQWWLVGVLGFFATLTRSAGILLVAPYLYELWKASESLSGKWRAWAFAAAPIVLIPLGLLLYCLYCWKMTGNPLIFASVQYHWARHLSWPWVGIWQALFEFFWNQPFGSFNEVHVLLDLSATLAFITLAVGGRRKLPGSYTLWTGLLLFYIILTPSIDQHDSLISNQRFVLEMFPAFITLAMLGISKPRLHQTLMLHIPPLLATLSLLFVLNRWMV